MGLALLLSCVLSPSVGQQTESEYIKQIKGFRKEIEEGLKGDEGWLTVAGLCWLKDGDKVTFSKTPDGHVVLPSAATDVVLGTFVRSGKTVTLEVPPDSPTRVNGKVVTSQELAERDDVTFGDVKMIVIQRGERIGIRVYDKKSKARLAFTGQKWFPIDQAYKIKAKYFAYDKPRTMPITNVLGDTAPVPNPGYVEFTFQGKKCHLEAQDTGQALFFNFKDMTTGKATYDAGRFLDALKPVDGFVTLDFNLAVNPPCAFTSFATCPLPPKENTLPVEINAGEKSYHPIPEG